MFEAAYEITISMICVFLAGAMLGWFLQEYYNARNKIQEQENELYSWIADNHVNCRCSINYPEDGVDDEDE